jgi:hypothetical protein
MADPKYWSRYSANGPIIPPDSQACTARQELSDDVDELARMLNINSCDRLLLGQIADAAATQFASELEALRWFDAEVRSRNPNLWWSIRTWVAQRLTAP